MPCMLCSLRCRTALRGRPAHAARPAIKSSRSSAADCCTVPAQVRRALEVELPAMECSVEPSNHCYKVFKGLDPAGAYNILVCTPNHWRQLSLVW